MESSVNASMETQPRWSRHQVLLHLVWSTDRVRCRERDDPL